MRTRTLAIINHNSRTVWTILALTLTVCAPALLPQSVHSAATVHSSARSAAMGGAFTGLAKGVNAARYNPANLGLDGYRQYGLEFASLGVSLTNNAFTLSDYNKYTGAVLSTSDKQDILGKIPTEGLSVDADIKASALSLALGSFVLSVNGVGAADINLSREIVDLILNGNTFADTLDITGSYSDGLSYAGASLSYGLPLYSAGTRQLAVGFTASYLRGIAIEEVVSLKGLATTYVDGFQGEGEAIIRSASGGSGYGLDLGAAFKLNNNYTAGVRIENVLSKITWDKEPQEYGYIFSFDTASVDDFDNDIVTSDDYTIDIEPFTTSLPAVMNVGLANTSGKLVWAVDWTQGFRAAPGASTKPRLAVGVEYRLLSVLPLRTGFMTGGDRNTAFSFGSGLDFLGFYLDAAVITGSTMSVYSAKGANIALSTGIMF
ncbi:MAG: hypothetical protein NTW07_07830 [candidate division Zixibacteria bacterium]|nr:hypothetical protein [candidate division Zixibacteria bacterium]